MEKKHEDFVHPVKAPGERFEGTFREALKEVFGANDESLTEADARIAEKLAKIQENERQAAIIGRTIIIY